MSCVHKLFKFGGFMLAMMILDYTADVREDKDDDNADDSIQANSKSALGMMIVMSHILKDCTRHDDFDDSHLISGW